MKAVLLVLVVALLAHVALGATKPFAVATVLRPDWNDPGAFFTDVEKIDLSTGKLYGRVQQNSGFGGGNCVDSATGEYYLFANCTTSGCLFVVLDINNNFAMKRTFNVPLIYPEDTQWVPSLGALIAVVYNYGTSSWGVVTIDVQTGKVALQAPLKGIYGAYVSRGALDAEGSRYFFSYYEQDLKTCMFNVFNLKTMAIDNAFPLTCDNLGDTANLQYNPNNGLLYFVQINSPSFASIDPSNGAVKPLFNLTAQTGGMLNYFASFFDAPNNTYWAQLLNVKTNAIFFVWINFSQGKPTLKQLPNTDGGNMMYQMAYVASSGENTFEYN